MKCPTEIDLKFLVPATACAALATEMARGASTLERISVAANYLDSQDRRLARAGLAWSLRREGQDWIQRLEAGGSTVLNRFEDEVILPDASPDASRHAGTPTGDRLVALLRRAKADDVGIGIRWSTQFRRMARRVRTRGAVVGVAFDEGRLSAPGASQPIREVAFELVSGSIAPMLALAERWRKRFGLIHDPRSKSERGDRLADGWSFPPLRKAAQARYGKDATARKAFGTIVDECLAQMTGNAIGVAEGDPALRAEHVHQLRVGMRRLRSALRSFEDWAPQPTAELVDGLKALFAALGSTRDNEVLGRGVMVELATAGAPPLAVTLAAPAAGADPIDIVRSELSQRTLLALITWRGGLDLPQIGHCCASVTGDSASSKDANGRDAVIAGAAGVAAEHESGLDTAQGGLDAPTFHRKLGRRLRRWHGRLVDDWKVFDLLDPVRLHALRKRIKRQRYAVEFFAPVLRRRKTGRYLEALAAVQDRMGTLNDLLVARARYQSLAAEPAAWFALGWLAARIAEVRALAKPELERLAKMEAPGC